MNIGGLDVGSSGAKITVVNQKGKKLFTGSREYPVERSAETHEINADDVLEAVEELLREAAAKVKGITAVGVTSFGESFVVLDKEDRALLPIMMYTDPRGQQEADTLRERLGAEFICETAGTSPHPMYSLPKLMWIRNNKPEVFSQIKKVCLIGDFIVYMLTGKRLIDYSLAARTMGLDIRKLEWSKDIFKAAEIDMYMFSEPVRSGTTAGVVLPEVARELGVPNDMKVVVCCHDQVAAAIGAGAVYAYLTADGGGTVQCITPVFQKIPEGEFLQKNHYPIIPFAGYNTYCTYAFMFTGGALLKWFANQFADHYQQLSKESGKTVYQLMDEKISDHPTGILVLPHFAGAATPYMDTGSKGVIAGLDLSHTPVDIYQAIMEGIAYEMRINVERLAEGGIIVDALFATGGCAKSEQWLRMKADILGMPVTGMDIDEAGTVGGIMLTSVAAGACDDLYVATRVFVQPNESYLPRKDVHKEYDRHYQRYRLLYNAVRPLFDI